jgi:hypothetical protein
MELHHIEEFVFELSHILEVRERGPCAKDGTKCYRIYMIIITERVNYTPLSSVGLERSAVMEYIINRKVLSSTLREEIFLPFLRIFSTISFVVELIYF